MVDDIRWQQRFSNYKKALMQLAQAVELSQKRPLSNLEEQGLIQGFEYTYELACNTLKDYLESLGNTGIRGPKDAIQLAFNRGLVRDGEAWMDMFANRNKTSHTYDEKTADSVSAAIIGKFYGLFVELQNQLEALL